MVFYQVNFENLCPLLLERHGCDRSCDLVLRPASHRSGGRTRPRDIRALAGLIQDLHACCIGDTHGATNEEYAESLTVNRAAPEFCATDTNGCHWRRDAYIGTRQLR